MDILEEKWTLLNLKIEIDKTMTDNENASFIQQERIEKNKNFYNKAQQDIDKDK